MSWNAYDTIMEKHLEDISSELSIISRQNSIIIELLKRISTEDFDG